MTKMTASLRRWVIQRANNRCEYCGISQIGQVATFHIDHVIPVIAGGETTAENLALYTVFPVRFARAHGRKLKMQKRVKLSIFLILVNRDGMLTLLGMAWKRSG